jgi:hypothetical protein
VKRLLPLTLLTIASCLPLLFPISGRADRSGGGGVGNGGGGWTCRAENGALTSVRLVDLSESEREFLQEVPTTGDMPQPIASPLAWLAENRPYLKWAEGKIKTADADFYAEYLRRKQALMSDQVQVPEASHFNLTGDILREAHHTRPDDSTCPAGSKVGAQPEMLADFTSTGYLLINPEFWFSPKLQEVDRAALFVHEILYWMFRDLAKDTDSLRTRLIVGFIFSAKKPITEYASMITLNPERALIPGTSGLPLRYGMYGEKNGHFVDVRIESYDPITRRLRVTQRDRDNRWKLVSRDTFRCAQHGSELQCAMTSSTAIQRGRWSLHSLRIIDASNFVWVRLKSFARIERATYYGKLF